MIAAVVVVAAAGVGVEVLSRLARARSDLRDSTLSEDEPWKHVSVATRGRSSCLVGLSLLDGFAAQLEIAGLRR